MAPQSDDSATRSRFTLSGLDSGWAEPAAADEIIATMVAERYEIGRLIGSGGTARVYRAYDHRLDREVAIKVFHRDAVAVEQRRRLREADVMGSLDHPGLVPLFDTGVQDGHTYLVMRLVDGQNLADRLRAGPLSADEVTGLAMRLTAALAHVHERGVTHRDLKPANVLLDVDGPVISDFGIAHHLDATRVTATGAVVGTAAYMAPEQVLGEPVGAPADLYSFGLILLECVTGEREYTGTMAESAIARLTRQPRIPLDAPDLLVGLLRRMTARAPAARPTAAAVHGFLTVGTPIAPVEDALTVTIRQPAARRGRKLLAGGVLTAAAGVVAAVAVGWPSEVAGHPAQPTPPAASSTPSPTPSSVSPNSPPSASPVAETVSEPPAQPAQERAVDTGAGKAKPDKAVKNGGGRGKGGGGHGGGGQG